MSTMLERIQANRSGAGAGNPVSASRNLYAEAQQPTTMLDRILQQRQQSAAQTTQRNLYSQAAQPSTMLERIQQRQQAQPTAAQPISAGTVENREKDFLEADDRYRTALAEMQLQAASGGLVSADAAAQVQQRQAERAGYQQLAGQAAQQFEAQEYGRRLEETRTDVSQLGELLSRQRSQDAENQLYAEAHDNAAQIRLAAQQRELQDQIDAIRDSLRREGYTDEEITSLEGYLSRQYNAAETQRLAAQEREAAAQRSSGENLMTNIGGSILGGVGYLDLAAQNAFAGTDAITGRKALVDYNSDYQQLYHANEAIMQGEMDRLLEKYGVTDENGNRDFTTEGRFRAGAYQLAVSMGQSAAVAGLTAMGMPGAMLLLSGSAATQTTHEFHEKGFSDGTSLLMGGISGAAEYVTEKIGMDSLFKTRDVSTAKNVVRAILRNMRNQALAEGGEEVLSTIINTVADLIVNGNRNALNMRVEELMAAGMTREQAREIAGREWLQGLWNDFYMGALSGMLFGMGGTAFQSGRNVLADTATGREIIRAGTQEQLINTINGLDAQIRENANVPTASENSGARELGAAARGLERAQIMENIRNALIEAGEENPSPELVSALYHSSLEQEQRLTREERRAIRGSEAAQELAEEWRGQWDADAGSSPDPFSIDISELFQSPAARQRTAQAAQEDLNGFDASILFGGNENARGEAQGKNTEGVLSDGEQSRREAPENGYDSYRAGEQGRVAGEGEGAVSGGESQVRQGVGQVDAEDLRGREVTPAELGIVTGSSESRIHIQTDAELSENARQAQEMIRGMGMKAVPFTGEMILNNGAANAVIQGDTIYYRTDAVDADGNPLDCVRMVEHEATHPFTENNPERTARGMAVIGKYYSAAELEAMKADCRETYKDIYDFESMSEDEILQVLENELFGDAFAGINEFADNEALREEMHQAFPEVLEGKETGEQTDQRALAAQKKSFASEVDRIVYSDDSKPFDYKNVVMRNTPKVLLDLGFSQLPMTITSKHIYTIANEEGRFTGKNDHYHNLGAEGVKSLFNGIETPVLAYVETMPEGNTPARIVMIVPVVDKTGQPVMVGVECAGTTRVNEITVLANPVITAYGKNENTLEKYIEDAFSEGRMLYADKERSQYLPAGLGPNDLTHFEGSPYSNLMASLPDMLWSYDFTDNIQRFKDAVKRFQPNKKAEKKAWRVANEGTPRALAAGRSARTANSTTLQQAEQMARDGASNEEIRQETGWYKGRDGQWRFEIDDSGAKYYRNGDARFRNDHPEYARYQELMGRFLNGDLSADELLELQGLEQTWGREQQRLKGLVDSGHATLDMLMDHPALFEAYPQLREARIRFTDMEAGERGAYNSRTNSFTLSNELRSAPESTLIHEIQHAIQAYEGFSGGSSVEYWENQERSGRGEGWKSDRTKALEQEYTDLMESLPEETRQLIREANQAYADGDFERIDELEERLSESPYGSQYFDLMALEGRIGNARDADRKTSAQFNYMNTAGEIEARDSANRRNMTAEERKNTPPDLGDENTVFAEGGVESYSIKNTRKMAWEDQIDDYFKSKNKRKLIKSSDTLYLGETNNLFGEDGVNELPLALPQSEITKAMRRKRDSNSRSAHDMTETDIRDIRDGIDTARAVLYNPDRNSVVYITSNDSGGFPVVVAAKLNHNLNGDMAHTVTTIHPRESIESLLFNLPASAKIKIKNEFASELASKGILQSPKLLAKVEFIDDNISFLKKDVNTEKAASTPRALASRNSNSSEQREILHSEADEMADGSLRGIDVMPGEGEDAVSSAVGLTEVDNARLDAGTFSADELFGPTNAQKEAEAAERAQKEGNDALREFADRMPDDPMDLYAERNPVNARKGGGDGGDDGNGPRRQTGYEKMTVEKGEEKKTLRQKISDAWHRFIRSMVNEADAIHQAGRQTGNRALDGMYFYAKAATQRAQQWIQRQRMSFDLTKSGKSLNAIFDPIRAKGEEYYKDFQLYLYHMLNVERMSLSTSDALAEAQRRVEELAAVDPSIATMSREQIRNRARQYEEAGGLGWEDDNRGELIWQYEQALQARDRAEKAQNKPVFGWDVDADKSRNIAKDLLAAHPEFEQLAQEVYDYCDALLQYRVDAGLITAEDMNRLKEKYPHYVPVMYEMGDEDAAKIRGGNIQVSDAIKKAEGGKSTLLPLHYALARQTLSVMKNAGHQQLGATVLSEYENNPEIMGRYVKNVEESDAVWDEAMADNDDVIEPNENVITVFRDGKRVDITLSDDMSYAFKSLQPSRQGMQEWKLMQKGNDLFKKLCTAYNPLFMITNPIRDVQDALFYSTDTKRWIRNYPRAISQIAHGGKYWQMYQGMGGVNNSYFDWATGENAGKMGKVEALNMAIEQAPRLAEFMTVLENAERKNGSITQSDLMEAFNAAAEVTTNFSRGGTMGKWINRNLVPFWNPGVQGLSKAVRTVTETRGFKAWAGLVLKAAALGMLPELLNGLLYRDDDEWDKIDDQMKMEYYLFKGKDGVWIKIPKGRVLAALSMPVVGAQEALRGDDVDWGNLAKAAVGSVAPNNPLETNLFSAAVQAKLLNPDDPGKTWYGGNIESKRLQNYAPGERYDESTDVISKWLGGKLGLSPKKINYIIDQYSGVLGDLILPYLTPKAERGISMEIAGHDVSVPLSNAFMSRFTMDTVTNNTISGEYYDLLDELGYAAKSGDQPSAMAERYMNRAGSTVSDYYAKIREIENDPILTDREKTKLTRELRKQLNDYEQQVTADAAEYLAAAQKYLKDHPEYDFTDDKAVDAFVEGYNSVQSDEKYYIDADQAASMMKEEAYREINREHIGAEYALRVYNKDTYEKARALNVSAGLSYDDYYDYYFGTKQLYADRDENGNSISGSKKEKVVAFIDGMDITDEQKNALYIAAGYSEKSLDTTPWNGGSGKYSKSSGSRSGGSRRYGRSGRSGRMSGSGTGSGKKRSYDYGFDISELFPGGTGKAKSADASADLVKGIRQFASGFDASELFQHIGKGGRTTVDFEL